MPDRQIVAAGNKYAFAGFVDSEGFLIGSTPTAPVAASSTNGGMARIVGVKQVGINVPEPESVIVTWDDDAFAEFLFQSVQSRRFLIDVAIQDLTFAGALQDTSVTSLGGVNIGYLDATGRPQYDICAIFQSRAKKETTAAKGVKAWSGVIMPLGQAVVLGRQSFNERTGAVFRFSVTPQQGNHNLWGTTIYDVNNAIMSASMLPFDSDYPITSHRSTGNLTTIPVDYQPYSAATTFVNTERVNNVVSAVSTAGKTVTITTTPTGTAARTVTTYQFSAE